MNKPKPKKQTEEEALEEIMRLLNRPNRTGDVRLAWAPISREEREDMKTFRNPEDF